jgi:hypothetical protein
MPTGAPSLLLVGLTGVPADLTPIGAPCMLRSHPSAVIPGTGSAGSYSWTSPLTVSAINGLAVYLQAAAPDPTANSFGLVFSSGLAVIWPYQNRPAIRNWSTNDDLATTGNLQLTYGLVIKVGTY